MLPDGPKGGRMSQTFGVILESGWRKYCWPWPAPDPTRPSRHINPPYSSPEDNQWLLTHSLLWSCSEHSSCPLSVVQSVGTTNSYWFDVEEIFKGPTVELLPRPGEQVAGWSGTWSVRVVGVQLIYLIHLCSTVKVLSLPGARGGSKILKWLLTGA